MRSFKVSGATAAQRSYYLARLKCGLVKGKHIDEVFGSKTALVWLTRSGNADQLVREIIAIDRLKSGLGYSLP